VYHLLPADHEYTRIKVRM